MLGFVKKDLLLIKANMKSMIILFVVYFGMALYGVLDVMFLAPILGVMLFITTFSYDEYNHWDAYALTLPKGRKNIVQAKYATSLMLIIALGILSLILSMGSDFIQTNVIHWDNILSSTLGAVASCLILISLFCPMIFKFGANNARLIMFIAIFSIIGVCALVAQFIDLSQMISISEQAFLMMLPIVLIVMLVVSYFVSNKIYQNKEF